MAVCYWQMRWAWERQRRRPSTSAGGPSDSTNLMDDIIYIYIDIDKYIHTYIEIYKYIDI